MQFFPRTKSPLTVDRNWFNFSSCRFAERLGTKKIRLRDAGT
jgi:hypothetical protein